MMKMMPRSLCLLLVFLLFGVVSASREEPQKNDQNALVHATTAAMDEQRRNLLWSFDFQPDADPGAICDAFQQASQQGSVQYECTCNSVEDKSVDIKCLQKETNKTCTSDNSVCYLMSLTIGLDLENKIEQIETCTKYVDVNTTVLDGTSTKLANYSDIEPCVRVLPEQNGDFSQLKSCSASVNGQGCYKCEICGDSAITMDCCNTNPNGEPLKVDCGQAVSGAFAPFFDPYEEGEEGTCASAAGTSLLQDIQLILLIALAIAVPVSFFL